jgi:chemotaxis protein histidine kinase CheA
LVKKAIKLNYRSAERFSKDYALLKRGKIFLPSKTLLPLKTTLIINFTVPQIDNVFTVTGVVVKILDEQIAAQMNKPTGMLLALVGETESILNALNSTLSTNKDYRDLLGLAEAAELTPPSAAEETPEEHPSSEKAAAPIEPAARSVETEAASDQSDREFKDLDDITPQDEADADLTLEWLRDAVDQEEVAKEDAAEPEITVAPTTEKKELSLKERKKVKPSGDFLMDLTKAMLRSGYYSAEHPGSKGAKQGLYEKFQKCLDESREIEITKQEDREKTDILISGILEEPVNVRTLVGAGMAELFVPKLREYFKRKGLVTFAIKNDISIEHFESFAKGW